MVEHYTVEKIRFEIQTEAKSTCVIVSSNLQHFKLIQTNAQGPGQIKKIAEQIRRGKIKDWNALVGSFGKTVSIQDVSAWR